MGITEVSYALQQPIQAHVKDGNGGASQAEVSSILLKAPSTKQAKLCFKLRQFIMRAIGERQEASNVDGQSINSTQSAEADSSIDGKAILTVIMMSDVVDSDHFYDAFEKLIEQGIVYLNSYTMMNVNTFQSLSEADSFNMMGQYLENFIMNSLIH